MDGIDMNFIARIRSMRNERKTGVESRQSGVILHCALPFSTLPRGFGVHGWRLAAMESLVLYRSDFDIQMFLDPDGRRQYICRQAHSFFSMLLQASFRMKHMLGLSNLFSISLWSIGTHHRRDLLKQLLHCQRSGQME